MANHSKERTQAEAQLNQKDAKGTAGHRSQAMSEYVAAGHAVRDGTAKRTSTCPFRKFHPAQIRVVRQNHRIIRADACNLALARNVRRRLVQVAVPA